MLRHIRIICSTAQRRGRERLHERCSCCCSWCQGARLSSQHKCTVCCKKKNLPLQMPSAQHASARSNTALTAVLLLWRNMHCLGGAVAGWPTHSRRNLRGSLSTLLVPSLVQRHTWSLQHENSTHRNSTTGRSSSTASVVDAAVAGKLSCRLLQSSDTVQSSTP